MHPFVHLSIVFWLYMALQYWSSMSNFLVFHTSGGISSSPAAFLFLSFLCTMLNSSCVNCPSLMSSWLLIIFVTFGGFPSKFSKCFFHRCIHSSWLAAFNLTLAVLFLVLTSFIVCHAILDCLSSTEFLILMIWFCMYAVCSFRYTLVHFVPSWVSLALILVGFLQLHRVFTSARFFLTANIYHGSLGLALCLVGMHFTAAFKWALTKFSYSSFGVSVSDIS